MYKLVKSQAAVVLAGALLLGWTGPLAARDFPSRLTQSRPTSSSRPSSRPFERRRPFLERFTKELSLTADQLAQVKKILETHRQALRDWNSQNGQKARDLRKELADARKGTDQNKIQSLRQQLDSLDRARHELWTNMEKQLAAVLTPDQMAKAGGLLHRRPRGTRLMEDLGKLQLNADQQAKVKEIRDKAESDAQAVKTEADKDAIWKAAAEKIRATLTDAQRAQLQRMQNAGRFFESLKLSDEQKGKIELIKAETEAKCKNVTDKAKKREIVAAGFKKIFDEVLTDSQRAKFKAEREQSRHRGSEPASRPAD